MLDAWRTESGIAIRNAGTTELTDIQLVPGTTALARLGPDEVVEIPIAGGIGATEVTFVDSTGARLSVAIRD